MSANRDAAKAAILAKLADFSRRRLDPDQAPLVETFMGLFYARVSEADLAALDVQDLYGAVLSEWHFLAHRAPGRPKVRVYNPEVEEHGWQSTHTVISVLTDDSPFLVDSVRMGINRLGLGIHLLLHPVCRVSRDAKGRLTGLANGQDTGVAEAVMHVQVDRRTGHDMLLNIQEQVAQIPATVRLAVNDWPNMRARVRDILTGLEQKPPPVAADELEEARAFLGWMDDHHFTLLGYREYDWAPEGDGGHLQARPKSSLGILRRSREPAMTEAFDRLPADPRRSPSLLLVTKTSERASIHRDAYMDYVGVKRYDDNGQIVGECRLIGLFTAAAYIRPPRDIPLLRRKVANVAARSGLPAESHSGKVLAHILDTYPRDDLFEIGEDELLDHALTILDLEGRQRYRLLIRRETFGRFFSCIVYLPRDRMDTLLRLRVQAILMQALGGTSVDYSLNLTETLLARLQFIVHVRTGEEPELDVPALEARIAEAARSWADELEAALLEQAGEETGNRWFQRYRDAFPAGYREDFPVRMAVHDIGKMDLLQGVDELGMSLYQPLEAPEGTLHFKLIRREQVIALSDALPMLENMGVRVVRERPYRVATSDGASFWIHDFGMRHGGDGELDTGEVREIFQEAFARVWDGSAENDGLNRLALSAALAWREIAVLRAYAKYLRQIGSAFSQAYMEEAVTGNPAIARLLVALFRARFDPARRKGAASRASRLAGQIMEALEGVASLDADRILRSFLALLQATVRTNYYQRRGKAPKPYLAFKFDPSLLPDIPEPRPAHEIFVYSPRVEGVHLRGGKVARGGLRWSDRREDFRTEVLGLMKAQMVKNSIIVPVGAKGGFVLKQPPPAGEREALMQELETCYRTFIRGLLDLTDNLVGDHVRPPPDVVRYDDDDFYLVVAADKGTASFSDTANAVAAEYDFWLGDAFASGGTAGYDHKKMAITARGAWESVKRHFREMGRDAQREPFTAIGIGDMSGDVFGNGMLQSRAIRLLAAFDHRHIFLDPDPDPETGYGERERLFALPRSSWADYDPSLISEGGGVHPRSAKSVRLSPQVRAALGIQAEALAPNELIRAILKAPADLVWNGGVGTFVKASGERHADIGDRGSDAIRVNARELRCAVVAEGGNLGMTQLARVEFALAGGRVNSDFIDNSGGVACSDHEVNIKVLLDRIVAAGDLTRKHRNRLLLEMTDEVAALVLQENRWQNQVLSLTASRAAALLPEHARYIRTLERGGKLNRALEFLPDDEAIAERASAGQGLTRPELALLLAYAKIVISDALAGSDLPDDPCFQRELERYFPRPLRERFGSEMQGHRLRGDLVATFVTNRMVNRLGPTFVFRVQEDTGIDIPHIARAYTAAWQAFAGKQFWSATTALGPEVATEVVNRMLDESARLLERATFWLLRHRTPPLDVIATVHQFAPGVESLAASLPALLGEEGSAGLAASAQPLLDAGVPEALASRVAAMDTLYAAMDIIEVAGNTQSAVEAVALVHFSVGAELELDWLRDQIGALPATTPWASRAQDALGDELLSQQRSLTTQVLRDSNGMEHDRDLVRRWMSLHAAKVQRWLSLAGELKSAGAPDLAMLNVAQRELRALVDACGGQ